jgi:hypothetical protein
MSVIPQTPRAYEGGVGLTNTHNPSYFLHSVEGPKKTRCTSTMYVMSIVQVSLQTIQYIIEELQITESPSYP